MGSAVDPAARCVYRVAGVAAIALVVGYLVITRLYVVPGPPPNGGEAWFGYVAGKTTAWWAIVWLSIATDLLFVPVAFGLYTALAAVNRNAVLLGVGHIIAFVVP